MHAPPHTHCIYRSKRMVGKDLYTSAIQQEKIKEHVIIITYSVLAPKVKSRCQSFRT